MIAVPALWAAACPPAVTDATSGASLLHVGFPPAPIGGKTAVSVVLRPAASVTVSADSVRLVGSMTVGTSSCHRR